MALTEEQLVILNNLIYLPPVTQPHYGGTYLNNPPTLEEILEASKEYADHMSDDDRVAAMTRKEVQEVLALAEKDPDLMKLKVSVQKYDGTMDAGMACFYDEQSEQAYAVFRGTGKDEWRDDSIAGNMTETKQQEQALRWVQELPYDHVTVSGHSKGGNKAMYIAVVCDEPIIDSCYAFDGEGFSNDFLEGYGDKIRDRAENIHLRANYKDFVNVLLNYLPGIDIRYVQTDRGVTTTAEYHSPNALFTLDSNGNMVYSDLLSDTNYPAVKMIHELTVYMMNHATEAELTIAFSIFGEFLQKFISDGVVNDDIVNMFGWEGGEIILRYLTEYLRDLQIRDPMRYVVYRHSFAGFIRVSDNFLVNLLVFLGLESKIPDDILEFIIKGDAIRQYKLVQTVFNGNVKGRDFSEKAMNMMIKAAEEVEQEDFWDVSRWDCWYRIEKKFGHLKLDNYTGKADVYYRKLIDINNASAKKIKKIFKDVYAVDSATAGKLNDLKDDANDVLTSLTGLTNSIVIARSARA